MVLEMFGLTVDMKASKRKVQECFSCFQHERHCGFRPLVRLSVSFSSNEQYDGNQILKFEVQVTLEKHVVDFELAS